MRREFILKFLAGAAAAAVLAWLVYQLPPVKERLSWRLTVVSAYFGGIVNPADQAPTPNTSRAEFAVTPTATATLPPASPTPVLETLPPSPTPPPTATPTPIPPMVRLESPEWEKQGINNCGPAALSTYLRFYGWEGDQYDITEVIKPVDDDRNVNVEELAYYAGNHAGWLGFQYRVGGSLEQIKQIIAIGLPVMVEATFHMDEAYWPRDDMWAGHYLVVTGYDDTRKVFTTQDTYYGADKPVEYAQFDEDWKSFNRVLIILYPPDRENDVRNILGSDWDLDTNRQNALAEAQAETEKDPTDALAWFNLGSNLVYFERYLDAAAAYDQARNLGLPQRMYRYQFGPFLAYFHTSRNDDLLALTEYALERTPNSEEALLWNGWALYRAGDVNAAAAQFQKALEENPNYNDAIYALNFIRQ